MTDSSLVFKVGTRGSRLALRQTGAALDRLRRLLPGVGFEATPINTPGDRDRQTDLRDSPSDFFSKDLDEALLAGAIDCAVHSAKDLPEVPPPGIDCFWLPWREDPRDAIVLPASVAQAPSGTPRIGVSSERRVAFCRAHYPQADLRSIRGNIEQRLAQLDRGDYDLLIMAVAALNRLGLQARISQFIELADLPVPAGQGALAMTFRRDDHRVLAVRNLLVPPVILAGAGIGSLANVTRATLDAVATCDVCLPDALLPRELLALAPPTARVFEVGKRQGRHSVSQEDICRLICRHARRGERVVRLKGGDPAVFGRLAEEIDALESEKLPYRVLPGVGAYSVAAASTGILPSRRGLARGFTLSTPRRSGSSEFEPISPEERLRFPQIVYMGASLVPQLAAQCLAEGWPGDTPLACVHDAGAANETRLNATLAEAAARQREDKRSAPGLVYIGEIAQPAFRFQTRTPLAGARVLFCGAESGIPRATREIERYGGHCLPLPTVVLRPVDNAVEQVAAVPRYDWLLITSPSCAEFFLDACRQAKLDVRRLPRIMVAGPGTAAPLQARGIEPDLMPKDSFGAAGLLACLAPDEAGNAFGNRPLTPGSRVLRLRSNLADDRLSDAMRKLGAEVTDVTFYENHPARIDHVPEVEAAIFTSTSSVDAFVAGAGAAALGGKVICAIGEPTLRALRGLRDTVALPAFEATIPGCVQSLAGYWTVQKLKGRPHES